MASGYLTPYGRGGFLSDSLFDLHREMNRLFDDAARGSGSGTGASAPRAAMAPRLDVHESQGELTVMADLPGMKEDDIDLRLDGDILTISGERRNDAGRQEQNYHVMERSYGRFRRSVQLPFVPKSGEIDAHFEHGVLTVRIPRRAEQERNQRIAIRGGGRSGVGVAGDAAKDDPANPLESGVASQ